MSARWLQRVRVTTTAEAEDAVSALLVRIFQQPASVHHDLVSGKIRAQLFLLPGRRMTRRERDEIETGLAELRGCGLDIGSGKISHSQIPRENWAHSWKRHFKPLEFGKSLLVKPGWSQRRARVGQATIVLDPGLSFGTGQHATTSFCLRVVAGFASRARARRRSFSFLDVGTGSGILAIAAAKLGASPVHGFDFDPEAVRIAKGNAGRNRVTGRVRLWRADLTKLPRASGPRYDLVCANLTADLLLGESSRILGRLKQDGALVLAGILDSQFKPVREHYERAGLILIRTRREKEWRSGLFRRG